MSNEQKLGVKVFYYYLSKRITAGVFLFILAFIFYSLNTIIISNMIFVLPLSLAVVIVNYLTVGLFVLSFIIALIGFLISWIDYISCTFTLDEESFDITRGIFNKKEVSIPYRQIQDIDVEQSFFQKFFGVSKLVILTAGNDDNDKEGEAEGVFQVIDANIAEKLRENLLQKTSVQKVTEVKS